MLWTETSATASAISAASGQAVRSRTARKPIYWGASMLWQDEPTAARAEAPAPAVVTIAGLVRSVAAFLGGLVRRPAAAAPVRRPLARSRRQVLISVAVLGAALIAWQLPANASLLWGDEKKAVQIGVSTLNNSGGETTQAVSISEPLSYDHVVSLSATHSGGGEVSVPSSVTIPAGETAAGFTVTYGPGSGGQYVSITAQDGSETITTNLNYLSFD